jgi:hypothetical protein
MRTIERKNEAENRNKIKRKKKNGLSPLAKLPLLEKETSCV